MSLWDIKISPNQHRSWAKIRPVEILAEFDEPLTFTFSSGGVLYLAHSAAVGDGVSRYFAAEADRLLIEDLANGLVSIRQALHAFGAPWIIDINADREVIASWRASGETLHERALPSDDVLLTAELEAAQESDVGFLEFAQADVAGQLAFGGRPVVGHTIDANFYGSFCAKATELMNLIASHFRVNAPRLFLGMTFQSSYGVDLQIDDEIDVPKDGGMFAVPIQRRYDQNSRQVFERLMSMLMDAEQQSESVLMVKVDPQIRQKYGDILELVATRSASVTARTRSRPQRRELTTRHAEAQLQRVRDLGWPYMFVELVGVLFGGYVEKGKYIEPTFALHVENESGVDEIKGTVASEGVPKMKQVRFGETVWTKLMIVQKDEANQTYRLIDVKQVDPNTPHGFS